MDKFAAQDKNRRTTLTVYQESFMKENFCDMSIVTVCEKTFANLVIQLVIHDHLCIISFEKNNTRKCSRMHQD